MCDVFRFISCWVQVDDIVTFFPLRNCNSSILFQAHTSLQFSRQSIWSVLHFFATTAMQWWSNRSGNLIASGMQFHGTVGRTVSYAIRSNAMWQNMIMSELGGKVSTQLIVIAVRPSWSIWSACSSAWKAWCYYFGLLRRLQPLPCSDSRTL